MIQSDADFPMVMPPLNAVMLAAAQFYIFYRFVAAAAAFLFYAAIFSIRWNNALPV